MWLNIEREWASGRDTAGGSLVLGPKSERGENAKHGGREDIKKPAGILPVAANAGAVPEPARFPNRRGLYAD